MRIHRRGQTEPVEVSVRRAASIDVGGVVNALQQAFYDDPVMGYLFPDDRSRRWRMAKMFATELRAQYLPLGATWTTADHAGAALWAPPGHWSLPPARLARHALPLFRAFGRRLPRALRALSTVEQHHPTGPHWYLAVLGTVPHLQGRGVGSALLAPVLGRCDEEGVPAYLESSKESNLAFYGRQGFEVTKEITLPGGPPVWAMWREPR
jgi:GNAT superfamily N-acetyltransferase